MFLAQIRRQRSRIGSALEPWTYPVLESLHLQKMPSLKRSESVMSHDIAVARSAIPNSAYPTNMTRHINRPDLRSGRRIIRAWLTFTNPSHCEQRRPNRLIKLRPKLNQLAQIIRKHQLNAAIVESPGCNHRRNQRIAVGRNALQCLMFRAFIQWIANPPSPVRIRAAPL